MTSHAALDILLRDSLEGHLLWSHIGSSHTEEWGNQSQLAKKDSSKLEKERKKSSSMCDVWLLDIFWLYIYKYETGQDDDDKKEWERAWRWLIGYLLVLKVVISAVVLFTSVILYFINR